MRDGNSSLYVALTTQRRGSGPRPLGVDHRPCQLDGAETPVPTPDRRGEAALSGSCTDWDQWGDAGRPSGRRRDVFCKSGGSSGDTVGLVTSATVVQVPALQNRRPLYRNQTFKRQKPCKLNRTATLSKQARPNALPAQKQNHFNSAFHLNI